LNIIIDTSAIPSYLDSVEAPLCKLLPV